MSRLADLNIAFRVDASSEIGTGHLFRCITLADSLRKLGAYTRFICRQIPDRLHNLLVEKKHAVTVLLGEENEKPILDLMHSAWLGVNQNFDARETMAAMSDKQWSWIVVDHYGIDCRWQAIVKKYPVKLFVIDDLIDRDHLCDMFLNQNILHSTELSYTKRLPNGVISLIGPKYALLREEFQVAREKMDEGLSISNNILVFFGGIDADDLTSKAIDALSSLNRKFKNVDVVVGSLHPNVEKIRVSCESKGYQCHVQISNMATLMQRANFSIGAAGSASWERCCLGLPAIVVSAAENQESIAIATDHENVVRYIGTVSEVDSSSIASEAEKLINNPEILMNMSKKALSLVDGYGCKRVVDAMCSI